MSGSKPKTALLIIAIKARRIGGIEVFCHELAARLGELGWRVVFCFDQEPAPEVRQYLSMPHVVWEKLPNAWTNSWQTMRDLSRIIRRHRPRLMHLQFTPFLSLNAWLARLHGVGRVYFTDHGSHPAGFIARRQSLWKRVAGCFLNMPVRRAIAVSDYNRNILATLGTIPADRTCRIYNGVNLSGLAEDPVAALDAGTGFRARHKIPGDRILVTQVSWIIPEKGIPDVLEAARLALAEEPRLHFAFVGDGRYMEEYAGRAVASGISEHVTWTGLVRDPSAEGVFSATDISCQASRWEEAFGLVIAEAMAFGKPFVATRVGGIPELVSDGVTGYLVPRGDAVALAEKFILLARGEALRSRLGRAGRARAEEYFDVCKNVLSLIELYHE